MSDSSATGGSTVSSSSGVTSTGEPIRIIKAHIKPQHPLPQQAFLPLRLPPPSASLSSSQSNINITQAQCLPVNLSKKNPTTSITHTHTHYSTASNDPIVVYSNPFSLNSVAAKITHVKTTTIDAGGGGGVGISAGGGGIAIGSSIGSANIGSAAGNTIMTSGGLATAAGVGTLTTTIGTPIALSNAQAATTATAIRAIGAAGQSTQVRVVMPTGIMPQSMIKQLEGAASGRTQITAIPTGATRSVSNTSITVTRPVTQTTYLPRAGVTASQMTAGISGITAGQRLVTPIRATPTAGVAGGTTVTGLTPAGSFVRSTAVSRNTSSPAATSTWMTSNAGQVQLIRAIPHQSRQRTITAQSLTSAVNSGGISPATVSGTAVVTNQTAVGQANIGPNQAQQGGPSTIQMVSSHSQQQQQQQQTYVATLAAVLPPRQHQTTLVYSSNVATSQPLSQPQQFNPSVATAQRFAVATPLTGGAGTAGSTPRQIRPIPLGKSFSTAKLNTTSISIRGSNIPQLTPTLTTGVAGASVVSGATGSPRSTTVTGVTGSAGNVIPTTNLPTTRIIQLQQQPGGATQQFGTAGRLATNVMLHPIIVNTSGTSKLGFRPPVTMAAKAQPSLTITQLGIGKLPATSGGVTAQQSVAANIQAIGVGAGVGTVGAGNLTTAISTPTSNVSATNLTTGGAVTTTHMVNVSQGGTAAGQLLTAQNIVSSATVAAGGATVVPLAITTRGASAANILAGTITPIKSANAIKVMTQAAQVATATVVSEAGGNAVVSSAPTSVYIHHAPQQRSHGGNSGTVVTGNMPVTSISNASGGNTTVLTSSGATVSTSGGASGAFLPPGSTIYYESVPANTVQVSTGVLSLATTTVTSSTMSQSQIGANTGVGSNLAISSLPFSSHAPNTTATFTVVPASGGRTIGQLQIPVSNSGTQIQAVPVRLSAQLAAATSNAAAAANNAASAQVGVSVGEAISVSQTTTTPQLVHGTVTTNSAGQQILIPAGTAHHHHSGNNATTTLTAQHQSGGQTMVIPLQTSIKVTSGGPAGTAVISNFIRKRETDGSPIRAAKNLGPTLLSMGTNIVNAVGSPAASSVGSAFSVASSATASTTASSITSVLTAEALAKKDRNAAVTSTRTTRADSPASSDGSTTVSANSSPGVEQQMQDGNRMPGANDATHFNPINELYANHPHAIMTALQHNIHNTPISSRNSSMDHQQQMHVSSTTQRINGGPIDCLPRKRSRRSTNDSQHSTQSQASLSLPPPSVNTLLSNNMVGSNLAYESMASTSANGAVMLGPAHDGNNATNNINHKTNNMPPTAGNKENAKPVEFILRRPRNCTLLNSYKQSWKAANNHFQRYSDVKPREERRPTVIDLANQANVLGKINGWKIHHLRSQMEDLCENETKSHEQLGDMLKQMEIHENNTDIERISDLIKGNMQRSKIIAEGIKDAENQIMKIFEHKSHISDIINRCASKRNFKKREKV